jgi:hypothetical protein
VGTSWTSIHLTAMTWPLVTPSVWSAKNCLGGKHFAHDEVETEMRKWQRTVRRLLCCGFWWIAVMGQVYHCCWRNCFKFLCGLPALHMYLILYLQGMQFLNYWLILLVWSLFLSVLVILSEHSF